MEHQLICDLRTQSLRKTPFLKVVFREAVVSGEAVVNEVRVP